MRNKKSINCNGGGGVLYHIIEISGLYLDEYVRI